MRPVALCAAGALIGLCGCHAPDPGATDGATDSATGAAETEDSGAGTGPQPVLSAAEVAAGIDGVLSGVGLPDPVSMLDVFIRMLDAGRDDQCPHNPGPSLNEMFNGCVSTRGYTYAGVSIFQPAGDGGRGFFLLGDCFFIDDAGQRLDCAGELELDEPAGGAGFSGKVTGTWGYPPEPGWIGRTPGAAVWMAGGPGSLTLEGGYAVDGTEVYFHTAAATGLDGGDGCASGAISLRDDQGLWYRLDMGDGCDGCGAITAAGGEVGEGCAEFRGAARALLGRMGWG